MPAPLYSIIVILICLFAGYGINFAVGGLPPSLYGMMLFTISLHYKLIDDKTVANSISWTLKNMGVCFVPAGVGIIEHYDLVRSHGIAMVIITFVTTWLLLTFVGWTVQQQENKKAR
ncbi:CidA/LrgA family protein [Thalassotalea sp. 1_MG-2023]|uniref:CidA/LrgA family protein n=1 Tax=Thalassotalea sp. 1_MG-2023 TaxID=3062680 RepID=UPI0026E16794|nr:CidA/LrgA family protein [Thalassotalea sp. 1_MG-2023]MDO6427474.1 CidA/LrgA family protein [Thalassotalea sp. 1_MG-2023]